MFHVDVSSVRRLPPAFSRVADDAGAAKEYVATGTTLHYGDGLINMARGGHELIVAEIESVMTHIRSVGLRGAQEVTEAIEFYESTDTANAEHFDGGFHTFYPGDYVVDRDQLREYARIATGDAALFDDRREPQSRLAPLPDYDKSDQFAHAPNLWDLTSPTSVIRDAIWYATALAAKMGILDRAYDPFESWVKPLAGDWTGVRLCADVFDNLARCLEDMGENSRWRALGVDAVWTGYAADAVIVNCWQNSQYMFAAIPVLQRVAARYREAAAAMFELGKTIGSLIADLSDAAMIFGAEVALAAGTSETLIGGAVFGAAALYEGYKMTTIIADLLDCAGRADSAASAFASASADFGFIGGKGFLGPIRKVRNMPDLPIDFN